VSVRGARTSIGLGLPGRTPAFTGKRTARLAHSASPSTMLTNIRMRRCRLSWLAGARCGRASRRPRLNRQLHLRRIAHLKEF
jgi:hypothetical protein